MAFPDSEIASKMNLGKTKVAYTVVFGIAKYFENEMTNLLATTTEIVLGFDESLNKISQKKQMDIVFRFWDETKNEVATRYFTSAFLGKSSALDLLQAVKTSVSTEVLAKVMQISMDGPNVNIKFAKDFQSDLNDVLNNKTLLDLGSCGLHTVHGAFKRGIKKTEWKLIDFLRAVYNLFKDVPARRADYTTASGSTTFPKKFCAIRWLENVPVVRTASSILTNLKKYVDSVKKNKMEPSCNSFKIVADLIDDKLLPAKLAFFESLAIQFEPFLKEFQSNNPLTPFLYEDLLSLMYNIIQKFVKPQVLSKQCITIVDLKDKKNLLSPQYVKIGYATQDVLNGLNDLTSLEKIKFKEQCRECYQSICLKLLERSPLKFLLVKGLSCLSPATILSEDNVAHRRLTIVLRKLVENKQVSGSVADEVELEFQRICSKESTQEQMRSFDRTKMRLDHFWMKLLSAQDSENYRNLLLFVKKILILSHGNAALERGFSVNKECLIDNLLEKSLVAQRIVIDGINNAEGFKNFSVTKRLIQYARNSHSLASIITELKNKKARIMDEALKESARIEEEIMKERIPNKVLK